MALLHPVFQNQGAGAQDLCKALNQALDGMAETDAALDAVTRLIARNHH